MIERFDAETLRRRGSTERTMVENAVALERLTCLVERQSAVRAERELCAKIAETWAVCDGEYCYTCVAYRAIAAQIRARGSYAIPEPHL
jgi:hypothetical protein